MADNVVVKKIKEFAKGIYDQARKKQAPSLEMPIRSVKNVKYDEKLGYFEMQKMVKERTLAASTIKTFAQTLLMMNESKKIVETDDIATKREVYYVSKNWGDAMFREQPESDTVMDDIEAMIGVNREQLGFIPEEKGGDIAGRLIVLDKDEDGKQIKI